MINCYFQVGYRMEQKLDRDNSGQMALVIIKLFTLLFFFPMKLTETIITACHLTG